MDRFLGLLMAAMLVGCATSNGVLESERALAPEDVHIRCYSYLYGEGAERDYAKAFDWCQKAAANAGSSSQTLLGEMYHLGRGTEKNNEKAAYWYEKAAAQGHPHAKIMLFYLHVVDNYGTQEERERGISALLEAAASGYDKAIDLRERYLSPAPPPLVVPLVGRPSPL